MSSLSKAYLVLYNAAQFAGWGYMLCLSAPHLTAALSGSSTACADLHRVAWPVLALFQTAAALEVAHAALGIVRSNPVLTAFQVHML